MKVEPAQTEAEFTAFVVANQYRLRRTAYLVCGDWHRAEDIVQTALVAVYSRWEHIRRTDGPAGYTHRAVVNAAIDEKRRPWRRERSHDRIADHPAPEQTGITQALLAALAGLPPRQRAVVVLRYVEDLDIGATAHALGISPGTVKSQAARGLATLRELFATTHAAA